MEEINALINGFGAIFESAMIVKSSALRAGFSEDAAQGFANDYVHLQMTYILRKASYGE